MKRRDALFEPIVDKAYTDSDEDPEDHFESYLRLALGVPLEAEIERVQQIREGTYVRSALEEKLMDLDEDELSTALDDDSEEESD
jgi:hypothetical protein